MKNITTYYKVTTRETVEEETEDENGDINTSSYTMNIREDEYKTLEDAQKAIEDTYRNVKLLNTDDEASQFMYRDTKKGESVKCGYIRTFMNSDISHNSDTWKQCDWIYITKVTKEEVLL